MPLQFPSRDFTQQYISSSYQSVVQIYTPDSASYFLDGLGNVIGFIFTSSVGNQILTVDQPAPLAITASYAMNGGSGGGFNLVTGASYPITTSWAVNAIAANTADFALESQYCVTASYFSGSISAAVFSKYSDTASYLNGTASESDHSILSDTASLTFLSLFADTSSYSFESVFSDTASLSFYANYAGSSSYALGAGSSSYSLTASFALNGGGGASLITGSTYFITASFANTASYVASASYYPPTPHIEKGLISGSSFSGNPQCFTVNYFQPFSNTVYVSNVTGEDARLWTCNSRTTTSFVINSNSNQPLVGMVSYRVEQI